MGGAADVHRVRDPDGHLHPLLCHPHTLVKPQPAQEPALLGDAQEAGQVFAKAGKEENQPRSPPSESDLHISPSLLPSFCLLFPSSS